MEKPVTKKELQKELKNGLNEVRKEFKEEIGATKKELRGEIEDLAGIMAKGFEAQGKQIAELSVLTQKALINSEKALKKSDEALFKIDAVILSNDHIAKEIKDMCEEQAAVIGGRRRVDDTLLDYGDILKDHEKRIKKLERVPVRARKR